MNLNSIFDGSGRSYDLDTRKTGDLTQLTTEAKETLVSAVNEVDGRVPKVTAEQNGCFVRVINGRLTAMQLTDVSEEGA